MQTNQVIRSAAEVATPNAVAYLRQMCNHFRHKRPVMNDELSGQISFPVGECRLSAREDVLTLSLDAPAAAQMAQLQEVVNRHLIRFAFREELKIDWRPA